MTDHPDFRQSFDISGNGNSIGNVGHSIDNFTQHITYGEVEREAEGIYNRKPLTVTPLTKNRLGVVSAIFAGLALIPAYGMYEPFADFVKSRGSADLDLKRILLLLALVLIAEFCALTLWQMRRIVKFGLQRFSRFWWLPVATKINGRFALARYRGACPKCGNKLRFLNMATEHAPSTGLFGQQTRVVTKRTMVVRCIANPERHCWWVDHAEVWPDAQPKALAQ